MFEEEFEEDTVELDTHTRHFLSFLFLFLSLGYFSTSVCSVSVLDYGFSLMGGDDFMVLI